jgi:hypothetical protein
VIDMAESPHSHMSTQADCHAPPREPIVSGGGGGGGGGGGQ